jgi:hypothetical protein
MSARTGCPMFTVTIAGHRVERWEIPERAVMTPAASRRHAQIIAVRIAHAASGLPPWKPLMRVTLRHATVTPLETSA